MNNLSLVFKLCNLEINIIIYTVQLANVFIFLCTCSL